MNIKETAKIKDIKMIDDIILRPALDNDYEFAYFVKKESLKKYVEETWGWDEEEQKMFHESNFSVNNAFVIVYNNENIGWLVYKNENNGIVIDGIFILPKYQNRGIGSKIINYVITKYRNKNSPVFLQVLKSNPNALRLYNKLGFKIYKETKTHNLLKLNES